MGSVRCFFCLPLSAELETDLSRWIGSNRVRAPHLRWVSRANLHITLRFCGEIPAAQVEELSARVKRALLESRCEPFQLSLQNAGTFGSPPRVLWVGLERDAASLKKLNALIEEACRDAGLERDAKKFTPHITLARLNAARPRDISEIERLVPWNLSGRTWLADTVIFMRSHLTELGPRYFPMAKYVLGAAAEQSGARNSQ